MVRSCGTWIFGVAVLVGLLSGAGCDSSQTNGGSGGATSATGGSGSGGSGAAGSAAAVWTSDATKFVVEDKGGGFVPPPPTGSTCGSGVASYTFTVGDGHFAWHVCTSGAVYTFVDGARTLTVDEQASLTSSWKMVTLNSQTHCGGDMSVRTLTISRPGGDTTYLDSFYSCRNMGIYVDGIDQLMQVATALAK